MHLKRHGRPDGQWAAPRAQRIDAAGARLGKDMSTVKERRRAGTRKCLGARGTPARKANRRPTRRTRRTDELAEWAAKARLLPEVRRDLVERVRAEIEAGTYETPAKMDAAIERLLEDLTGR